MLIVELLACINTCKRPCLNPRHLKAHSKKPTQLAAMLKHLFTTEQPNLCLRCRICVIIHPNPTLILKWTYLIMDAHVWPESRESSDRVKAARQQFLLKAVSDNTSRPKLNSPQHLLPQRARLDRKPHCSVGNVEFNCSYTEPRSFPTLLTWNSACCLSFDSQHPFFRRTSTSNEILLPIFGTWSLLGV